MADPSSERFRQVDALFDQALDLPREQHEDLLARAASRDPVLAAEVRRLLDAFHASGDFLEEPAIAPVAPQLRFAWDASAAGAAAVPERAGPFRVVREIGHGGMGAVFLGQRDDGQFEQRVALKFVRHLGTDDVVIRRFREERRILARLEHPRIARLLDGGVSVDGTPWFAMEYVDGERLDSWCDERSLPLERRLDLFARACETVQYAHQQLVVHRDLKPSNILINADGELKLLDFGIAKLLDAGALSTSGDTEGGPLTATFAMTPQYAAPEQVRGEPAIAATDVYALGALLYELLTGRRPYEVRGRSPADIERIICERQPPAPSILFAAGGDVTDDRIQRARARGSTPEVLRRRLRGDLDAVVMHALHKESDRRYPSAAALLEDIRRVLEGRPVLARPDSLGYRMRRFARRHRAALTVAAGIVVLLIGGFVREYGLRARAQTEARKALAVQDYMIGVFNSSDPFAVNAVRGDSVTARDLLERGEARIDRELAMQPEVQAELRSVLGRVYSNLGLADRAETQWRRALELRRELFGDRHSDVASAMTGLGGALTQLQRYDEAEPLLRGALAIQRDLGGESSATASTLDHLATMLRASSALTAADSVLVESLALRRRISVTAADSSALADAINNHALLLFVQGRYDEAEPRYREALSVSLALRGENHPNTARVVQNLAQVQQLRGYPDEAEELFRRSLLAKRAALGDLHPSVTIGMNNLGNFLALNRGKVDEADSLFLAAIELDRRLFGDSHGFVAAGLNNRANAARLRGRFAEAESLSLAALAIVRAVYPGPHRETAAYLNALGSTRLLAGNPIEAATAFGEAVEQYHAALGPQHLFTQTVLVNYARALFDAGDVGEAGRHFRGVMATLDDTNPANRTALVTARVGLGRVMVHGGEAREAIPVIETAVASARAHLATSDARFVDALVALGQALVGAGENERAREVLHEAVAAVEAMPAPPERLRAAAQKALADVQGGAR